MKNLICLLSLALLLTSCGSSFDDKKSAKLLFESGFEEGVYLEEPYEEGGSTWVQAIKGSDSSFSWPIKIWDSKGAFQVLVDSSVNSKEYIQNRIVTTKGHNGTPTRVMRSEVLKNDTSWTQDPYIIQDATEQGDLYVKYWLKLPNNLAKRLGDGTKDDGWCTFFEWKTAGDYRVAVYVYVDEDKKPYWFVHGDNVANQNFTYKEYWSKENRTVPVPENKWFMVEFFWHRSTQSDGRFWWAVNGKVVVDYHGANKIKKQIDRIMLFTVYAEKYPLHQEVDDIEIWNGFPCGEGKSCYHK